MEIIRRFQRAIVTVAGLAVLMTAIFASVPAVAAPETQTPDPLDCPVALVCVPYKDHVLEVDPNDGALVGFVVRIDTTTSATLDGTETSRNGVAVWLLQSGETYIVLAEGVPISAAQAAKPAKPGDLILPKLAE